MTDVVPAGGSDPDPVCELREGVDARSNNDADPQIIRTSVPLRKVVVDVTDRVFRETTTWQLDVYLAGRAVDADIWVTTTSNRPYLWGSLGIMYSVQDLLFVAPKALAIAPSPVTI